MALAINDIAPDFEADTTEGRIRFHDWIGDRWAVLFSHPKDFTPVCTTELGYMAKIKPEFDKRGVKVIGLSRRSGRPARGWASDIEETQGYAPNYPMIGDADFNVSKLYGMLPARGVRRPDRAHRRRQPDRAQRLRHRSGQEDQAGPRLSHDDRAATSTKCCASSTPCSSPPSTRLRRPVQLEERRGRHHRRLGHRTRTRRKIYPQGGRSRSPTSASCRSRRRKGASPIAE